jgi:hypothetical protein
MTPPSPPAEKATARQDQAGQASTDDRDAPLALAQRTGSIDDGYRATACFDNDAFATGCQ